MRMSAVTHPYMEMDREGRIFWGLFGASVLRNLAVGAIMVFLPVYLYGLSGLWLVILWLLVTRFIDMLLMKDFARIIAKLGFKKSVLLGQLLWVVVMYFVNLGSDMPWAFLPAAILVTFATSAYWIPYHLLFMSTSEKNFGKRASFLNVFAKWSNAIGPILGGIITVRLGFSGVFWWSAVLMAAAAIPILILEPEKLKWDFHLDHYWEKLSGSWFRRDMLAFVGLGIEQAMYDFFWPVFLLILLKGSYMELGAYKTAVLAVTSVVEIGIGRVIDRGGTRRLMMSAIGFMVLMWVMRGNFTDPWKLLAVDVFDGWLGVLVFLPFSVYTYRRAVISDRSLYLVESEASSRFGGFLAALVVGIFYFFGIGWNGMIILGVLGMSLMAVLPKIGPKQFVQLSKKNDQNSGL